MTSNIRSIGQYFITNVKVILQDIKVLIYVYIYFIYYSLLFYLMWKIFYIHEFFIVKNSSLFLICKH